MLSKEMLSLTILLCALWSSSSALNNEDYDLMFLNFENEIESMVPATEETISCNCQQEHTKWDKLFIMLENSQMKENMLLQSIDEILKVELQTLRTEMIQFVANFAGTCTTTIEKVTSQVLSQVDQTLRRNSNHIQESKTLHESEQRKILDEILQLSHNVSNRLTQLESVWQRAAKVETGFQQPDKSSYIAREDKFILNSLWEELQQTRAELKGSQKWAAQHSLPAGCETAILFPMRSKKIFGSVHPTVEMMLQSFTACIWVKVTEVLDKTIIFSYGTKRNPYEIQFYLSRESAVLAVGSDQNQLIAPNTTSPGQWEHYCGTWSSDNGTISLWANGELVATASEIAGAHTIPDGGILQLGQEKNGCCVGGGFDETLAFSGKLTGFNLWDRVLSSEEITARPRAEDSCNIRGNVVGWGVTEILTHGGAQYIS
uniref:Pentraxin-related protein PTX3 n=1 Tax=Pelodiscus sinensis TaxID=13735 RepID=K7FAC2_PELSI|nr:pentraxin-related protein PTX3 [Pelodiscus sinensis]|eukprot:XP_006123526.1 pentraxin-related protein PTX3 [Pelodiscus sinensis]